jgi:RNA polymerase sigma-70 factor (ECF subfamily)
MPRREDGPRAGVGRLYDEYGASLFRYALMILADHAAAEDAIQQVFLRLLTIDRRIEQDEHYLRRAVRNECYSALRRRGRSLDREGAGAALLEAIEAMDAGPPPDERLAIEVALRGLPAEQREVVHLHVFEGRTFQEIADLTDESINTAASRYRYALAKLRQVLTP